MTTRLAAWIAITAIPWTSAAGQFTASLDAGWATVHYDEYLRSSVFTVGPSLRLDYPRSSIAARGTFSQFQSGSRSLDVALGASTFTGAKGPFRLEFSGSGGGTVYNGFGTGHLSAGARLHVLGTSEGLWISGSGGYVDDGVLGSAMARYGAGGWARRGIVSFNVSANHLRADLVAVTDFEGGIRMSSGAFTASAGAGIRAGGDQLLGAREWGDLSATLWLGRYVALIGAHGRYPAEPGRGTPGGQYSTLAFRFATRPPALDIAIPRRARGETEIAARPAVAGFSVKSEADSTVVLTARAPGAARLEIAGDFTEWQPVTLEKMANGDSFILRIKLPPGAHKFNIRVDGGDWGIPPDVPVLRDEFTGFVALLIIP